MRSLLLRRTKDQRSNKTGEKIVDLPAKHVMEHKIKLDDDERQVYDKVFSFSQQAMYVATFLKKLNLLKKYNFTF